MHMHHKSTQGVRLLYKKKCKFMRRGLKERLSFWLGGGSSGPSTTLWLYNLLRKLFLGIWFKVFSIINSFNKMFVKVVCSNSIQIICNFLKQIFIVERRTIIFVKLHSGHKFANCTHSNCLSTSTITVIPQYVLSDKLHQLLLFKHIS